MNIPREQLEKAIAALGDYFAGSERYFCDETFQLLTEVHLKNFAFWSFCKAGKRVPDTLAQSFHGFSMRQLTQQAELSKFFSLLEKEEIPFVPIKGVDLAFRIYPEPVLRMFGDWDIWVQPHNLKRFLELLKRDGWSCPMEAYSIHHCGMRIKGNCRLEPHFSLPNFPKADAAELWAQTEPVEGKRCQRVLSNELNWIMLFQHNSIDHFQMTNVLKLLLDTEFLLRHAPVDGVRVRELTRKWHLPHPGILLAAFPEFFGGRYSFQEDFPAEAVVSLRDLLLLPQTFTADSLEINWGDADLTSLSWLKTHLRHYTPGNLSWKYPQLKRHPGLYPHCLCQDVAEKLRFFLCPKKKSSSALQRHLEKARIVEESWKSTTEASMK